MSYLSILTDKSKIDFIKSNYLQQIETLIKFYPIIKTALENININKYNSQIKIIEPNKKYEKIAFNAPCFLIDFIKNSIEHSKMIEK